MDRLTRAALGIALALGATACRHQTAIAVHRSHASKAKLTAGVGPDDVETLRERRAAAAHDVDIVATLWDGALVAAGLERDRRRGDDEATLEARRTRWVSQYLHDRTSFTVVIELGNRGPEDAPDPLLEPSAWSFRLDRGDERDLAPRHVELQGIDRFPSDAGGHHVRLAFAVSFDGATLPPDPLTATRVALRVLADGPQTGMKRRELGPWVAKHGTRLVWWLVPA